VSVSPPSSSSLGTPYVDPLYSHPSDAFAQPQPPPAQNFAYAHLPTHSDELSRVPGHVFQPAAETWLTPHRHQPQQQQHPHAVRTTAASMYAATHQPTPYGTAPYSAFLDVQQGQGQQQGQQQQQDSGIDMWQTVPTGYELEDWDTYISSVSGLAQHSAHPTLSTRSSHSHSHPHSTHPSSSTLPGGPVQGL
jgi:hypothetical protein